MKQLYLDLDGVFADFDIGVRGLLGQLPSALDDTAMWAALKETPQFYRKLPLTRYASALYRALRVYNPIFLSGLPLPEGEMAFAPQDKAIWLHSHLSSSARLITCRSRDKATFCQPGDVLLDDRDHYADKWRAAGGVFVHHMPDDHELSLERVTAAMAE